MQSDAPASTPPAQIGPYRILKSIGEGGMGAVYLAEQDHPNREVALKVIRADSYSAKLLRRFEHEAEMLGRLQHPGIAQIFEAGAHATPHGLQPYFAMEYVRGEPIDDYAKERKLGTHARLELAAKVCDAIEHAHQKGVIHRDLKPGNILVTEDGQPKILDFGVARITDADVRSSTLHTDVGMLVGTLAYMSPEQASGDPDQLDTRSDVYSLGVMIFELLTGQLPYLVDRRMVPESVRAIREKEPSRLSTHDRTLRGDVETIVAKALEKDKARRYPSASALAADIRRYLADEPISARPPSAGYQLSKFARRNKVLVGGIAAFILALMAGAIVATTQMIRAQDAENIANDRLELITKALDRAGAAERDALAQRDRASAAEKLALTRLEESQIEQKKALQAAAFLESLFKGLNPYESLGADTTLLRRILKDGAERISTELAGQPAVEVSIRRTLGVAYNNLGEYDEAEKQLLKAQALARATLGEEDRATLSVDCELANLLFMKGRHAEAEELGRRTLEIQERLFGPGDEDAVESRIQLGNVLGRIGNLAESKEVLAETLAIVERKDPPDPQLLNRVRNALALALYLNSENARSEELYGKVIEDHRARLGEDHPSTLEALANLALVIDNDGRLEEAEQANRRVLAGLTRVYGAENPQTLNVVNNLAHNLFAQGRIEEGEAMLRQCLEARRRVLPPRHADTLRTLTALSSILVDQGRHGEARPLVEEALEGQRATLGEDHNDTQSSKYRLAVLLRYEDRDAEAAQLLGEIAENDRRALGEDAVDFGIALYNWAGTLQDIGEKEQAEAKLREVLDLARKHGWGDKPFLGAAVNGIGKLLSERGEHAEADRSFEEALAMRRRMGDTIGVQYTLGDWSERLLKRGDLELAEPLLREYCVTNERVRTPEEWWLPWGKTMLGRCLAGQGRFEEAEPLLRSGCEELDRIPRASAYVRTQALQWTAEMYDDWDDVEPGAGHAESAAEYRARATPPE